MNLSATVTLHTHKDGNMNLFTLIVTRNYLIEIMNTCIFGYHLLRDL